MRRATLCVGLMALSMFISADTVIRDARGIDGTGAAPQESTSIWVKDGYIKEIGTELQVTDATRVFDARGMTIIPGLIDSHVHLFSLPGATFRNDSEAEGREQRRIHLRAYLANGVTSVLDTGISFEHLAEIRGSLASGVPGPRVYALGPPLSAPGGYADDRPESYAFNFNARNADAVDVMIDQLVSADTIGVKVKIEYGFGPFKVWPIHSPEVREAIVNAAAEFARISFPQWVPEILSTWLAGVLQSSPTAMPMLNAVGQIHAAGIPIVMGSDSGNWEVIPFEFHGPTSVREVELLNLAGMTKMEAIVASTSVPAQMLGLEGEIGSITVGARADLVILPDNPLTDLTVLTRPSWVM